MLIDSYFFFFNSLTRYLDYVAMSGPGLLSQCLQGNPLVCNSQSSSSIDMAQGRINCRVSRKYNLNRELIGSESRALIPHSKKGEWEGGLYIQFSIYCTQHSKKITIQRELISRTLLGYVQGVVHNFLVSTIFNLLSAVGSKVIQ